MDELRKQMEQERRTIRQDEQTQAQRVWEEQLAKEREEADRVRRAERERTQREMELQLRERDQRIRTTSQALSQEESRRLQDLAEAERARRGVEARLAEMEERRNAEMARLRDELQHKEVEERRLRSEAERRPVVRTQETTMTPQARQRHVAQQADPDVCDSSSSPHPSFDQQTGGRDHEQEAAFGRAADSRRTHDERSESSGMEAIMFTADHIH